MIHSVRFTAVLDTNVIYPVIIRDLLFWFAYYDMYTPKWSNHIFDEWNYSRLLSYLEYKKPVLMATDANTDIGVIAEENGYGLWCENGDLDKFDSLLNKLATNPQLRTQTGEKGYKFLEENYTVEKSYETIMRHFEQGR